MNQNCFETNQVVVVCEKLFQKVESSSTCCNKTWFTRCAFYRTRQTSFAASEVIPVYGVTPALLGSLSSDVFERRTSTGSGRFALLSRDFKQIFGQIVSIRIKTLGKTNTVASRLIKRGKGSLRVDVRRSKTSLLKLAIIYQT